MEENTPAPDPNNPMQEVAAHAEIFEAKWNAVAGLATIHYRLPRRENDTVIYDTFKLESHETPTGAVTGPFSDLREPVAIMKTRSLEERRKLPLYIEVRGVKWQYKNGDVLVSFSVNEKTEYGPIHYNTPYISMFDAVTDDDGNPTSMPPPEGMRTALESLMGGLRGYLAGIRMQPPPPEPTLFDGLDGNAPPADVAAASADAPPAEEGPAPDGKQDQVLYENPKKRIEAACCHWTGRDGRIMLGLHFVAPKNNRTEPECETTFDSVAEAVEHARLLAYQWLQSFDGAEVKKFEKLNPLPEPVGIGESLEDDV